MKTVRAFLLVGITFTLIIGTYGDLSTDKLLQNCVNILLPGKDLREVIGTQPTWNRTQLEHACKHVDEFIECFDNLPDTIQGGDKIKMILTEVFNYMCGEGRELYLKSRICLSQESVKSELQQCMFTLHQAQHRGNDPCKEISFLSKCVTKAADRCGEDAKTYVGTFIKNMASTLFNCGGLSHGIISAIIGAVCVTVVLIAFVIGALIKRKTDVPFQRMTT